MRRNPIVIILSAVLFPIASLATDSSSDVWAEREHVRYAAEQRALQQKEQQALSAKEKAEAAREYATRIDDRQALPVAERAVLTASRALEKVRKNLLRNKGRMEAVERIRSASAQVPLAAASTLHGTVKVRTAEGWAAMTPDTLLRPGQELRTSPDGFVEVLFDDGTRISLPSDSGFILESRDGDLSSYRLLFGRAKAYIMRLGQRRYTVRTPTAVIGVRGTEFLLETSEGGTTLVVLHGEVDFGAVGKDETIAVRQGERALLADDGMLRGADAFDLRTLRPWWEE